MNRTICICLLLMAAASPCLADDIHFGQLAYRGVTITDVRDNDVVFNVPSIGERSLPLAQVTKLTLAGNDAVNQAEQLAAAGRTDQAVAAYKKAIAAADKPWKKQLLQARLLAATGQPLPAAKAKPTAASDKSEKGKAAPTSKPAAKKIPPPSDDNRLASPDELVAWLLKLKPPTDTSTAPDLTDAQRQQRKAAYEQALKQRQKDIEQFRNKTVSWLLVVTDFKPADNGEGFDVQAQSASDYPITVQIDAEQADLIEKIKPGSIIRATGVLADYRFERLVSGELFLDNPSNDAVGARFGALLSPARIALAKPGESLPEPPASVTPKAPATAAEPPAPQAFFPDIADAHGVLFLIDTATSMQTALPAVKAELIKAIKALPNDRQFSVMFYGPGALKIRPTRGLWPTDNEHADVIAQYAAGIQPAGLGSDPIPALRRALRLLEDESLKDKPRAIYLVTDGMVAMHTQVLKTNLTMRNTAPKAAVHVLLAGKAPEQLLEKLRQIVGSNGGTLKRFAQE